MDGDIQFINRNKDPRASPETALMYVLSECLEHQTIIDYQHSKTAVRDAEELHEEVDELEAKCHLKTD